MRRNAGALFYFNLTRDVTYDYILKNPQRAGLRSTWQKMDIDRAIDAAGLKLGYSSLRKEQREAVKNFTGGNDVFLSVPTGGGKSLCYAILPLVFDQIRQKAGRSIVIVVSPLIALMKDQVRCMMSGAAFCSNL